MSNLRSIVVLGVTTWAFVVCFAVWVMFGVIGIPIKNELGLNGVEFGLLTSTPVLTGALFRLPLGIWTDRFGGWLGRRLFCRWHALRRAPLCEGASRFRYGGVRRRHERCGDQHVHCSS